MFIILVALSIFFSEGQYIKTCQCPTGNLHVDPERNCPDGCLDYGTYEMSYPAPSSCNSCSGCKPEPSYIYDLIDRWWEHILKLGCFPLGATGPTGPTGTPGVDGITGPPGVDGITGPPGVDGVTGPPGVDGVTGPPGVDGVTGPPGVDGVTGPPGDDGVAGPTGPPGVDGSAGPTGPTGPRGPIGGTILGPPGVTGPTGPPGIDGSCDCCPEGQEFINGTCVSIGSCLNNCSDSCLFEDSSEPTDQCDNVIINATGTCVVSDFTGNLECIIPNGPFCNVVTSDNCQFKSPGMLCSASYSCGQPCIEECSGEDCPPNYIRVNGICVDSICGNSIVEFGEQCENVTTCRNLGYSGNDVTIVPCTDCSWNTGICINQPSCGNGVGEVTEACDGLDFRGKTCAFFGFVGGFLSCNVDCTIDTGSCTS